MNGKMHALITMSVDQIHSHICESGKIHWE